MEKNITRAITMTLAVFSLLITRPVLAVEEGFQSISGADRSFTIGYAQDQEVQRFEKAILERNEREAVKEESVVSGQPLEEERLRVHRSFRVATLYDSNLFYNRTDPKDDLLMIYSPTLGFSLGKSGVTRGFLDTFYNLAYVNYTENSKQSRFNQAHTVAMGFRGDRWDIRIQNKFQPASARETGERTELASSNSNRVIAYSDSASVNLTYHWTPKLDVSANYDYSINYFPASSNENNRGVTRFSVQENGISPRVSYKLNSKNLVYVSGKLSSSDYFKNGEMASKHYSVSTGIEHRLTSKTDLSFQVGYDRRDYNQPAFAPVKSPNISGLIRHQFSPKISTTLSTSFSKTEVFDNAQTEGGSTSLDTTATNYQANFSWEIKPLMQLSAYVAANNQSSEGLTTVADPENPTLFSTRNPEDQTYRWGISWGWRPKTAWSYFLSYEFLNKFSSFKNNQYDDHKIAGSIRKSF